MRGKANGGNGGKPGGRELRIPETFEESFSSKVSRAKFPALWGKVGAASEQRFVPAGRDWPLECASWHGS
jgi:hypothetical protein